MDETRGGKEWWKKKVLPKKTEVTKGEEGEWKETEWVYHIPLWSNSFWGCGFLSQVWRERGERGGKGAFLRQSWMNWFYAYIFILVLYIFFNHYRLWGTWNVLCNILRGESKGVCVCVYVCLYVYVYRLCMSCVWRSYWWVFMRERKRNTCLLSVFIEKKRKGCFAKPWTTSQPQPNTRPNVNTEKPTL